MKTALSAWLSILIVLAFAAPAFYTPSHLADLLIQNCPAILVASGVSIVILAGQIDISLGSQFAVVSVITALAAKQGVPAALLPLAGAACGALLGLINGTLISRFRIPAIVATLAMMVILREGLRWSTSGAWVQNLPPSFQWLGLGQRTGEGTIVLITAVVFAALWWSLRYLMLGRVIYATGSQPEAARLMGINTAGVVQLAFVQCGLLTGLAAALNSIRFSEIPANAGAGLELKAIAAAVVGGIAISGGRGSLWGTLLGVALLGTISAALAYLHVDPAWEKAVQGAVILAAVVATSFQRSRSGAFASAR